MRAAPPGVRKAAVVAPSSRRLSGDEGVACILTSLETGRTFVSSAPRAEPPSGDANCRQIWACQKRVRHDDWYVLDPSMGPMSLRIRTDLPFTVTGSLTGHAFVARELTRQGVVFKQEAQAILAVADLAALEAAAARRRPRLLEERERSWVRQLAPTGGSNGSARPAATA
jgi:hypothetical protein